MFLALLDARDQIHIVGVSLYSGGYRTMCGKEVLKNCRVSKISFDDIVPGICQTCSNAAHDNYHFKLNHDLATARNKFQDFYYSFRWYHQCEIVSPKTLLNRFLGANKNHQRNLQKLVKRKTKYVI
jgi:hypothetical protein